MVTLLKNGFERIMRFFYEEKTRSFHLRELSRLTGLHEPSVSRFLNDLERSNVLFSQREANLKKYSFKKNKHCFLLFEQFDIERFEQLPKLRQTSINLFISHLEEKPVFVVLFGSSAKNTFTASSDVDLLLITHNKLSTKNAEKEVNALTGLSISSFQILYSDFLRELKLKEDKVVQSALVSGYPVYNNLYYYEVFFNENIRSSKTT